MKTHRKFVVLAVTAAASAALASHLMGLSLFDEATSEALLAAFASAATLLTMIADYSYRSPRDTHFAREEMLRSAHAQLSRAAGASHRSPVVSLTGIR